MRTICYWDFDGGVPTRDLVNDYIYGDGGFDQIFKPSSVSRNLVAWEELDSGLAKNELSGTEEGQFLEFLSDWMQIFQAAESDSGVTIMIV